MSATTVNAFPPLHAFNASRSWFIALIVLVHAGFFWGLTNGLTVSIFKPNPPGEVFYVPVDPPKPPDPTQIDVHPVIDGIFTPIVDTPQLVIDDAQPPIITTTVPPPPRPPVVLTDDGPGSGPVLVAPKADPRFPFSEPVYPSSEIRQEHEGTVVLRLQILADGRVGDVQIERSSGFPKLDESAAREARRWRMKPGTQNGVAAAMWATVPISFQLKD